MREAAQLLIALSSCGAIALLAQADIRVRRWGFVVGLVAQPLWVWASWEAQMWGIAVVSVWWSGWYAWGAATHFRIGRQKA